MTASATVASDVTDPAGRWSALYRLGFVAGAVTSAALNLADLVPPRRLMLYGALGAAGANTGLLWAK